MTVKSATYDIKAAMKSTLALISVAMKPEGSHQRTIPNTRKHLDRDEKDTMQDVLVHDDSALVTVRW